LDSDTDRVSLSSRCANFYQSGISTIISLLVQRETYEPVLLERRTKYLRKTLGRPELYNRYSHKTINRAYFAQTILRPLRMLLLSPDRPNNKHLPPLHLPDPPLHQNLRLHPQ
jgi:hypothetical protein